MNQQNRPTSRASSAKTLDRKVLDDARLALAERHAALNHRLRLLESELPGDVVDGPRDVGDVEFVRLQYENTRLQLLDVSAALHRIDTGEYGMCSTCSRSIEPERLEASPEAVHCVACSGR